MSTERTELTKVEIQRLNGILPELNMKLTSMLGQPVEMAVDVQERSSQKVSIESTEMRPATAPFNMLVKAFTVGSWGGVYCYRDDAGTAYVEFELHISYSHHDGGSNGHSLNVPWGNGERMIFTGVLDEPNHYAHRNKWYDRAFDR